jgi:pimeloyl-ACP methyl ester carboxylesterase
MAVALEHMHVEANGIMMHVVAAGPVDAQPMVLLHGFPEGWQSWRPIMERLGDRYRMYAPDLRGYGGTDKPQHGYDVMTLTDDVLSMMHGQGISNAILVGHDWGGGLAWVFGHRYGRVLKHLVIVNCTHPRTLVRGVLQRKFGQHRMSWYMGAFQAPRLPELLLTRNGGDLIRRSFYKMAGDKTRMNKELVEELVAGFRTADDARGPVNYYREAARMQVSLDGRQAMTALYAQTIACPVTMVWGDQDKALAEGLARESHVDAHCEVDFRTLPGVGHFVSLEAPDELAAELDAVGALYTAPPDGEPATADQ